MLPSSAFKLSLSIHELPTMLARRSSRNTSSSTSGSFPQSFDNSQGDVNASQASLGDEGAVALVAMGGLGLVDENEAGAVVVPRKSARIASATPTDINPAVLPHLVVEGIVGRDNLGVSYSPQKFLFTYSSASTTHALDVDRAIKKALAEFNALPDCFATRFKTTIPNYTGLIPSVVGGLSAKYKNKAIPLVDPAIQDDITDVVSAKRKRK